MSASCSHVIASPPPKRATAHAFSVNEHGERIAVFLHDRPRDFVLRFPAVIESNDRASRRYVLFAPLPCEQILHRNHRDTLVFQFLHLRFKRSGRDLGARIADLVDQPMITKNNHLSGLIDDWLLDLGSCRHHRSGRRSAVAGAALPAGCGLSVTACCFLHIEKFSASSNGRIANRIIIRVLSGLSAVAQNTSAFYTRYWKHANRWQNSDSLVPVSAKHFDGAPVFAIR